MSRNYFDIPRKTLLGQIVGLPINLDTPKSQTPHALSLTINWAEYGSNGLSVPYANELAIPVSMQQGITYPIDRIRSVYIDNSNSDINVVIYFGDTQYTVMCQPRAVVWWPVITNLPEALIIGQRFRPGTQPATRIIFSNVAVPPGTAIERPISLPQYAATNPSGTTSSARDLVEFFRAPVVGDLIAPLTYPLYSDFALLQIGGTPYPAGYGLYITNLRLDALASRESPANEVSISNADLIYGDTGTVITTAPIRVAVNSIAAGVSNLATADNPIYDIQGAQIRLDASRPVYLRLRNNRPVNPTIPPFHSQLITNGQIVYAVHFDNEDSGAVVPPFLPVDILFQATASSVVVTDVYTFPGIPIGAASFERVVLVCVFGDTATDSNALAVSIAGQDASLINSAPLTSGARFQRLSIYGCVKPDALTLADIVVAFSGNSNKCAIAVFTMTGTRGAFGPFQTRSANGNAAANSIAVALDIPANGGAIAFAVADGIAGALATWTGLGESFDFNIGATDEFTGLSLLSPTALLAPLQVNWVGAHANTAMLALSFAQRT